MKRDISAKYEFVGGSPGDVIHHACSACLYHTPSLSKLVKHMKDLHTPVHAPEAVPEAVSETVPETVPEENNERRKKVRIVDQISKERADNRSKKDNREESIVFIVGRFNSLTLK
ncbi:hypothetical protein G6F56_009760 [Rhizopus delemar]|nr:hypothetical protein G6F56_009760 [Rhizopus delemar]